MRNPQGLALSSFDNKIYMSNHGARGGDWFGEVKRRKLWLENFRMGGPTIILLKLDLSGNQDLQSKYWVPSIATSAITIYKGKEFVNGTVKHL